MKATELIMNNLKAMGANPTATTDRNGNTIIKVNAPTAPNDNDLPDFTSPECFFCEPD